MVVVSISALGDHGRQICRFVVPLDEVVVTLMMAWCEYNNIKFHEACFITVDETEIHPAETVGRLCGDPPKALIIVAVPRPQDEAGRPFPFTSSLLSTSLSQIEPVPVWRVHLNPMTQSRAWILIRNTVPQHC